MKKLKKSDILLFVARAAVIIFLIAAAIWYFASGKEFSVEAILHYTPSNWFLATGFMLLLYAMKSIVFFLPLMVLQIAVGLYFPTWAAILVNILGMAVELNLPYWLGRKLGFNTADKQTQKYPVIRNILEGGQNKLSISYILRAVNMLPMDVVSMYLGSLHFPYLVYFTGSMVGAMFGILAATFIGMSLTDPTSPLFILSVVASCVLAGTSFLVYRRICKKQQKQEKYRS